MKGTWSYKASKRWYVFWKIMLFVSLAYLIFAIIPPMVSLGIIVGIVCLAESIIFLLKAKRDLKRSR